VLCVAFTELVELIEFTRSTFLQHVSKAKAAKLVRMLIDLFLDMEAGSGKEVRIDLSLHYISTGFMYVLLCNHPIGCITHLAHSSLCLLSHTGF